MATKKRTTYEAIVDKFRSMPLTKFDIPEALEAEWLSTAVSDYELNIGCELRYDEVSSNDVCIISAKRTEQSHGTKWRLWKRYTNHRAGRYKASDKARA